MKGSILILLITLIFSSVSCEAQELDNLMTEKDKKEMLTLVNKPRENGTRCGRKWHEPVPALQWDERLESIAAVKSRDMQSNNYFDHTSPDGKKLNDLLEEIDYRWVAQGENLAMGSKSVETTVNIWLKSEGHCRNIMNENFTNIGTAQYGTYWTMVLTQPFCDKNK